MISAISTTTLLWLVVVITCQIKHHKGRVQLSTYHETALLCRGLARTQTPTTTNYAPEFPTFGEIARVSPTEVQWKGLALGEPPC